MTEDDPDAGEFMVQCETCKAWQHGLCMGYESEEQLHDDDYYCEQCRPELHTELLKSVFPLYQYSGFDSDVDTLAQETFYQENSSFLRCIPPSIHASFALSFSFYPS